MCPENFAIADILCYVLELRITRTASASYLMMEIWIGADVAWNSIRGMQPGEKIGKARLDRRNKTENLFGRAREWELPGDQGTSSYINMK